MVINKSFIDLFTKATERAAYGASLFRGKGDKNAADKAAVDEIGQGRVWTGYDAKSIGLIDSYGGIEKAIEIGALLAKIENYRIIDNINNS